MAKRKKVRVIRSWMRDHPDDVPCPRDPDAARAWRAKRGLERARRSRFCSPASVPRAIRGFKRKLINWKASRCGTTEAAPELVGIELMELPIGGHNQLWRHN